MDGLENEHYKFSQYYQFSLITLEKFNEAYKYSKKLENKKIDSFESNLISGVYNLKQERYDKAFLNFQKLKKLSKPDTVQGFVSQSLNSWISFLNVTNVEDALSILDKNSKTFEQITNIQKVFAYCYFDSPKTNTAFKNLTGNETKKFSRYIYFHANYLLNKKNKKKSIEILQEGIKLFPRNLILNQLNKDIELGKNFTDKFSCKNLNNVVAEFFFIISNALASQGGYISSNLYLILAKYLNPEFISYNIQYAENFYSLGKKEKAKKIYKRIKKNGEVFDWYASKIIASILIDDKQTKKSLEFLKINFNKIKNPDVYQIYSYADFLKSNEKFKESIQYYTNVLTLIDKKHELYPKVMHGRGIAFERNGEWEKAEKDFLNSLNALPDQAYVINYLAYSWIEKGINVKKSLEMLEKANKLRVNDGYITDSLGWALFKLKNFKEAQKYLELAVRIMPSDPVINEHYADSLWMNNHLIQARYYWKYVLSLEKVEKEQKKKLKEKLLFGLKTKI